MAKDLKIDNHKLMYHPERVAKWAESGDCYPVYVEICPTNMCNHRCVFCCYDFFVNKSKENIDREVMLNTLREMAEKGVKSVMFAGDGEPFLHENIIEFIEKAKEFGLDVSMTTNGSLLTKEIAEKILPKLSWIRFSVNAGSPENYANIHRTLKENFERVINNIKTAVQIRNENNLDTTIGVQFLLIPQNRDEVIKLAGILKEIGVDNLQIKPYSQNPNSINKFVIDYEDYAYLELGLEKFKSKDFQVFFRKQTIKRIEQGNIYPKCYGLSFFTLIDAKGDVYPCSLFYDKPEFICGNLNEKSFNEVWTGEKRKQIIEKINPNCSECRPGCRLDVINRYLHRVKNQEPHDNFI